jgi:hypothetical protein
MQFENRLTGEPSSLTRTKHGDEKVLPPQYSAADARTALAGQSGALRLHGRSSRELRRPLAQDRLNGGDRALRTSSEEHTAWRAIAGAAVGFVTKAIVGFAACGEVAFPRLLLVVMSWTIAQALAGCAAYAVAMHPCLLGSGESLDGRDPARGARSGQEDSGTRLATVDWRALDHRPLKDLGISCADIEYLAGRGDRRE